MPRLGKRDVTRPAHGSVPSNRGEPTLPLSVVVVAYDIARELPRTLQSLAGDYQRGIAVDDYEVIVVDNGSPVPVDPKSLAKLKGNFRLVRIDDASPSPASAVNRGIHEARGETIGVMIDGARLASPGLLNCALVGSRVHTRTGVATLGWYVGYDFQRYALEAGWTKADEDRLLESIRWPRDGYRLFEVSTMDESSVDGWFSKLFESNALFLAASVWDELGGLDERFDVPGGGFVNHDALVRASELDNVGWVIPLGEATFHQLHGGIATNDSPERIEAAVKQWHVEYAAIRGKPSEPVLLPDPVYLGTLPASLRPRFAHALNTNLRHAPETLAEPVAPVVSLPDRATETNPLAAEWMERAAAAARDGRDREALEFARLARKASPASAEVLPLASFTASGAAIPDLTLARRVQFLIDAGWAHEHAGDPKEAEAQYREALRLNPGNLDAYDGLARLTMPGPDYYERLGQLHELLNPATYLEIGSRFGASLAGARPPTVAVAVDPDPRIREPIQVGCHLYRETSTEFFTRRDVRELFGGKGPSLVFIDGLHEFPTSLEDFWRVEAISDPDTIVVLHDVIPLDEITSRPQQVYEFYTGDGWKLLHCLAAVRPDLSWFTLRTQPSGLTFVTGLDRTSTLLRDQHDKLVERFDALTFDDSRVTPGLVLDNDWDLVTEQLGRWRAATSTPAAGASSHEAATLIEHRDADALARRVRELEESNARAHQELAEAKRTATHGGALVWMTDPESAHAALLQLQQTKLLRWTRPLRKAYSRLRGNGEVI